MDSVGVYAFCDEFGEEVWSLGKCITAPAQMPDIDALLDAVKCDPIAAPAPAPTPEPAVPVGEEGRPYFGIWNGVEMSFGGERMNLADFEMTMILMLLEDGRMILAEEEIDLSNPSILSELEAPGWHVENGVAIGEGCTMTLTEDGRLVVEEEDGQIIFERHGDLPESLPAPVVPEIALQSTNSGLLEVKYVCTNYEVSGFTLAASSLGGEYSMIFHENGMLDFVVVGSPIPGLTWIKLDNGNFLVDFYGNKMEVVWTEEGFDMNYMDSMLMHFISQ